MVVLVVVLLVTNVATVIALYLRTRRRGDPVDLNTIEVFEAPRPAGAAVRNRRLLTIEILNALEVAGSQGGRLAGLAGSLAPGLTRRVVYERTLKTLRSELGRMGVDADVRAHTLRAVPRPQPADAASRPVIDAVVVDEVAPLDLDDG
ncbi:MAG: hypothetical protein ACRDVG_08170 [Jatrophihabitantaceae bacterium]